MLARSGLDQPFQVAAAACVDLGPVKSVFFRDPNGMQLEPCFEARAFTEADLHGETEASVAMLG